MALWCDLFEKSGVTRCVRACWSGWSTRAHGLRHGDVQDRMAELLDFGFARAERMGVVSQELGHFRPDIVIEYLR